MDTEAFNSSDFPRCAAANLTSIARCIVLASVCAAGAAHSAEEEAKLKPVSVGLHTFSWHSQPGYNNINPGIYLHWPAGWVAGVFRNSYRKLTVYGGWLWNIDQQGRFSLMLGAATGYDKRILNIEEVVPPASTEGASQEPYRIVTYSTGHKIVPLLIPSVRFSLGSSTNLRLSLFSDFRRGSAQALHLSFERGF